MVSRVRDLDTTDFVNVLHESGNEVIKCYCTVCDVHWGFNAWEDERYSLQRTWVEHVCSNEHGQSVLWKEEQDE